MIKRVVALVIMAMLFSFNCEKGCGMAKKDAEVKEQTEQPAADQAAPEGEKAAEGEKAGENK